MTNYEKKKLKAQYIQERCNLAGIAPPWWVRAILGRQPKSKARRVA